MSLADLGNDFNDRFGELLKSAGPPAKDVAALVPVLGERSQLHCTSFPAGKDVELILVRTKVKDGKPLAVRETLTYRNDVAGTDLIYDLTGQFMQGKARPFECDLRTVPARLYARLPFQIEQLAVKTLPAEAGQGRGVRFQVEFQDALGKRAAGALPCRAELRGPDQTVKWERYLASSREGALIVKAELPADPPTSQWTLVVRSQLDGSVVKLPVGIRPAAGK